MIYVPEDGVFWWRSMRVGHGRPWKQLAKIVFAPDHMKHLIQMNATMEAFNKMQPSFMYEVSTTGEDVGWTLDEWVKEYFDDPAPSLIRVFWLKEDTYWHDFTKVSLDL